MAGKRKLGRILGIAGGVAGGAVVVALLAGLLWARGKVAASLPVVDGKVTLEGLGAEVEITRDALGVPTVRGESRLDVARALGFLHGQERFFQMDLMRRAAAGELAEIVGRPALGMDRAARVHRFRHRARVVIEKQEAGNVRLLEAYAEGVNAGLAALGELPFEYLLLGVEPEPWKPEDTVLVIYAMFLDLSDETGSYEATEAAIYDILPLEVARFLAPAGCEWDAPVVGDAWPTPPVPGSEILNLRKGPARTSWRPGAERRTRGSNNWVVSGGRTAHGGAILASDMHLGISVPNIWYRASLEWEGRRVTGVTLPGAPAMVAGTNTHVAWGFTNSYGDWVDLVVLETDPGDPSKYRTPEGLREISVDEEKILVKGEAPEVLEVRSTIWGPVIDRDHAGRLRAVVWTAYEAEAVNMEIMRLEEARSVSEALEIAPLVGIPPQNMVVADAGGHIGWTIAGRIPERTGWDGRFPVSWADGTRGWNGWVDPGLYPRIEDPEGGVIWTANTRVIEGEMFSKVGHGGYELGARATQIRDALLGQKKPTERDMLEVQLDDRALFLSRWRDLILEILDEEATGKSRPRREFRRLLEKTWTGKASVDSVAYRLVRDYRLNLFGRVYSWLTAPCAAAYPAFDFDNITQWEGPLWKLATERPPHLLDPSYGTWREALLDVVDLTIERIPKPLSERTWGERNTAAIKHPMSLAVPALGMWLDMPGDQIPGDSHMPRVIDPDFGASERFAVSPGREAQAIFHMPCGQSGHPLSPNYDDGHEAWVKGLPTPLLPGKTVHTLTLVPGS